MHAKTSTFTPVEASWRRAPHAKAAHHRERGAPFSSLPLLEGAALTPSHEPAPRSYATLGDFGTYVYSFSTISANQQPQLDALIESGNPPFGTFYAECMDEDGIDRQWSEFNPLENDMKAIDDIKDARGVINEIVRQRRQGLEGGVAQLMGSEV